MGILIEFSQPADAAREALNAWLSWRSPAPDEARILDRLKAYSWESAADKFERIYARAVGSTERLILATRIQVTSRERVVCLLDTAVAERRPLRLAFVNANLANEASANPRLAAALEDFYLLNDGIGLDLASSVLYGRPFPENLNGTDFTPAYLDQSKIGLRLFLLGSKEDVVSQAAEIYRKRWPRHEVVGFHQGFFSRDQEAAVAEKVRVTRPDIVLAAMGNPRQEFWLSTYIPEVCPVGIGVGALFDFQTSQIQRAPASIRKARLEWVYRLSREPGRLWKRYLAGNGLFLARVIVQYARGERA
jgi:alpha-1,3-mannosyltransferase